MNLVRVARAGDIPHLAANLRPEDRAEIAAGLEGFTPQRALEVSYVQSFFVRTMEIDGQPAAMLGLSRARGFVDEMSASWVRPAIAWLLGTPALGAHRAWFLRETRRLVTTLPRGVDTLYNDVDARYAAAVRWMTWLGFRPIGEVEYRHGVIFVRMVLEVPRVGVRRRKRRGQPAERPQTLQ